jgi:hypothetical protein
MNIIFILIFDIKNVNDIEEHFFDVTIIQTYNFKKKFIPHPFLPNKHS